MAEQKCPTWRAVENCTPVLVVKRHFEEIYSRLLWEKTGVYKDMDQWIELRRKIRNEEVSLRQLERETGIHRQIFLKNGFL